MCAAAGCESSWHTAICRACFQPPIPHSVCGWVGRITAVPRFAGSNHHCRRRSQNPMPSTRLCVPQARARLLGPGAGMHRAGCRQRAHRLAQHAPRGRRRVPHRRSAGRPPQAGLSSGARPPACKLHIRPCPGMRGPVGGEGGGRRGYGATRSHARETGAAARPGPSTSVCHRAQLRFPATLCAKPQRPTAPQRPRKPACLRPPRARAQSVPPPAPSEPRG